MRAGTRRLQDVAETDATFELIEAAREARTKAYAPYSGFKVGAAIRACGRIFVGANVENASFGVTMCAERVALGAAIAAGCDGIGELAVVVDAAEPVPPCGACMQALAEFHPALPILLVSDGIATKTTLADLFPRPFALPEG